MKEKNVNVKVFGALISLLFSFCLIVPSVLGQSRSTITGYVFSPQRRPVSEVRVELMDGFNSVIQRTKTDGSGRFFFTGVPGGRLSIRILPLATDFEEQTQEVEVNNISPFGRPVTDNVQLDFYLRARRNSANITTTNGVIFAQEVPEEAKKIYGKAISDLDAKRVDLGIEELKNALKLFPTYYSALEKLGLIYISQQKYENARNVFSRAVAVNSRSFTGWYGLGYANYALKESGAAVEAAQKAVTINSNSVDALLFLGVSQRQAKQYQEAEKSLKRAEKFSKGNSADVHWNLALLYAHNFQRYREAADELELYLKINSDASNTEAVKKLIKKFRENSLTKN